jgi:hypothetical protein
MNSTGYMVLYAGRGGAKINREGVMRKCNEICGKDLFKGMLGKREEKEKKKNK